jgi:hypothetical protein
MHGWAGPDQTYRYINYTQAKEYVMTKNVGTADRIIRVILGLAIITFGVMNESWWGALGIIPLFTATIGWCPVYLPFGISSCSVKKS